MLNATYGPDGTGVWWLNWTPDPAAAGGYDILLPDGSHVTASPGTSSYRLGTKPAAAPKIRTLGGYEIAVEVTPGLTVTQTITDGQTITVPITWEAKPSAAVTKVDFYIDGAKKWQENISPYVFNGDGNKLNPAAYSNGPHTFEAWAYPTSGAAPAKVKAVATVQNTAHDGRVSVAFVTGAGTDALLNSFTDADWAWVRAHWQRIYVFPPYSDRWLGKMPPAWAYQDAYAIYNPSEYANQHPDQIFKSASGVKLSIPWGGPPPPQYAADFSNPNWRQNYSDRVKAAATKSYGLYADDVNLDAMKATDGRRDAAGNYILVAPVVGGKVWTLGADWQPQFAAFMQKVKADNPQIERVHNALWWAGNDGAVQAVQDQIKAATHFSFERGFNDSNYNLSQFTRLFAFIDKIHSWGVAAYHLSYDTTLEGAKFNLGCALLCSNGTDYVSSPAAMLAPKTYQPMFDTDLGSAPNPRYQTGTAGILQRDFTKGVLVVNLNTRRATIPGVA